MKNCVVVSLVSVLLPFLTMQFTGCIASCSNGLSTHLQASPYVTRILTSPNYPSVYGRNENCKWRIASPEHYVVHARLTNLSIEGVFPCNYDKLTISDADLFFSPTVLCGNVHTPRNFYSRGQIMDVIFRSDGSISGRGFRLEYSALRSYEVPISTSPPTSYGHCPSGREYLQAVYGSNRTLTSPNYPENYNNNLNCKWAVTAPRYRVVYLNVKYLDIEGGADCPYDSLNIYNEGLDFPLATLCGRGHASSRHFYSSGRTVNITFKTDFSRTNSGFVITYTAVRPSDVPPPTTRRPPVTTPFKWTLDASPFEHKYLKWPGNLQWPDRSSNSIRWHISCDYGYSIQLYVEQANLLSGNCDDIHLTIFDSDGYSKLHVICSNEARRYFNSQGTSMFVQLTNNVGDYYRSKFSLIYSAVNAYSTTTHSSSKNYDFNYGLVVVPVVGISLLTCCICIVVRICNRRKQTSGPQVRRGATAAVSASAVSTSAPQRSGAAASQTNVNGRGGNGVYVVPDSRQQPAGGHSNLAFGEDFDQEPPSYFSLQPLPGPLASAPQPPPAANVSEIAPPSYSEAMMTTYPPVGYKVDDDGTEHIQWGVPMGTPPPLPPTYLPPMSPASDHQESAMVVGSNPPAAPAGRGDEDAETTHDHGWEW